MDVNTTKSDKEREKEKSFLLKMVEDMEGDNGHDGRAGAFAMMTTATRDCTHRWHARSLTHTRADLM